MSGLYGNKINLINEVTLYKGDGITLTVQPSKDRNYGTDMAYFKIYDSTNIKQAKREARIKVFSPDYIPKHTGDGMEEWILNNKEKKLLEEILKSNCNTGKYNGMNVYDSIIDSYKDLIDIPNEIKLPEYRKEL